MSNKSIFSYASNSLTPDEVAYAFRTMPSLMQTALKRQATRFKRRLRQKLSVEPGSVRYPIEWTSERQRRAFFATDGFGQGIPTQRTGALSKGWDVDINFRDLHASIETYNKKDYERFVTGQDQQQFHKNTGWLNSNEILDSEHERFGDVIRDTVFTVADDFAGVR